MAWQSSMVMSVLSAACRAAAPSQGLRVDARCDEPCDFPRPARPRPHRRGTWSFAHEVGPGDCPRPAWPRPHRRTDDFNRADGAPGLSGRGPVEGADSVR